MPDKDFMPGKSSVVDAIFAHRWAILPAYLETIIQVANREGTIEAALAGRAAHEAHSPSGGNPFAADKEIAVIPVLGPIFPRANLMTMISGATSVQKLTAQFKAALDDPNIGGIILNVDSPGGEVTGVSEFAQMVFDARGKKPITAYVPGMAASAAYWIASAADEIVIADTGEAGSIGVVAAYTDDKEAQRKKGVYTHEIVSSQSPNKRPDISTKEGRALIQAVVDDLAGIFVSTVARNRGVSEDHVSDEFGQGAMFVGARAADRRMVDKVGTFESVVQGFQAKMKEKEDQLFYGGNTMSNANPAAPAAAKPKGKEEEDKDKEKEDAKGKGKAKAEDEEEDDEKDAKGKGKGKGAEAPATAPATAGESVESAFARIQGIESLKAPGYEAFIAARKWEPGMTKEKLSALIMDDMEAKRQAKGAATRDDALDLAKHAAAIGNTGDLPQGTEQDAVYSAMLAGANSRRR